MADKGILPIRTRDTLTPFRRDHVLTIQFVYKVPTLSTLPTYLPRALSQEHSRILLGT